MHTKPVITPLLLAALLLLTNPLVIAGRDTRTVQVHVKHGASSTVVEGSITGHETVDWDNAISGLHARGTALPRCSLPCRARQ